MMPRSAFICLLVWLVAGLPIAAQAKLPFAELSQKSWDFGEIDQGETDARTIRIHNKGAGVLRIKKVSVTCGCLTARVSEQVVPPGGSVDLVLGLRTLEKFGKIEKQVLIATNDFKHAILSVNVKGTIHRVWWIDPGKINLGNLPQTMEHPGTFQVKMRPDTAIQIESITCSDPRATASATPLNPKMPSDGWVVSYTLPKSLPLGYYNCRITVSVSGSAVQSTFVDVFGNIHGPIRVSPNRINFGKVDPKKPKALRVFIEKIGRGHFSLTSITCAKKEISWQKIEHEKGRVYELLFTLKQVDGKRFTGGKITIITTEPTQRRIDIQYVGRFM